MKKIIIPTLILGLSFISIACTRDDVNTDQHAIYQTQPGSLVTYAQKELSDFLNTPSVNENNFRLTLQYWQETTYVDESNYNFTNRNVSNNVWTSGYVNVLKNLDQAQKTIEAYVPTATELSSWPTTKKNQLAMVDIMKVFTYQMLVDIYGDIPYSQSLNYELYPLPKYDKGQDVYSNLITRLKQDISNIEVNGGGFKNSDIFYYDLQTKDSDMLKWKKFGNSLLLKLGIGIADYNPSLAQTTVNDAINGGVISSVSESCQFNYLDSAPNFNPLFGELELSGRNDFIAGKTLLDYMLAENDGRISKYYQLNDDDDYVGQVIGAPGEIGVFSPIGDFAYTSTTPGNILTFTEVSFYLAEAAARWGIGGTPSTLYANAVNASFTEWGASGAGAYLAAHPYDPSNWKKSIGEQAWVAMFNQGLQGWNFYRRLDYPQLAAPPTAIQNAEGKVPVRLQYPALEATTNSTNYAAAGSAIGGDKLTTKIFWDKF
ncbi:SusD/RagB family nutrient-binding outer membrane lipoprotein [Chryseobacterium taichungense]|uniref:SusD/RagB family nutrient-binding outer membrane lipoprotein n=1 Tax=Chryseobacterium taichungense TaxID=295069 RepID=UPI0028A7F33A|nr:SusD/RagB family nutrient-binding outer membrane lipoprotein [Chryseobacterium taichungense]